MKIVIVGFGIQGKKRIKFIDKFSKIISIVDLAAGSLFFIELICSLIDLKIIIVSSLHLTYMLSIKSLYFYKDSLTCLKSSYQVLKVV